MNHASSSCGTFSLPCVPLHRLRRSIVSQMSFERGAASAAVAAALPPRRRHRSKYALAIAYIHLAIDESKFDHFFRYMCLLAPADVDRILISKGFACDGLQNEHVLCIIRSFPL